MSFAEVGGLSDWLAQALMAAGIAFRNARPISFGSRGFDLNILKAVIGNADAIRTHALTSYEKKVVTDILATKKSSRCLRHRLLSRNRLAETCDRCCSYLFDGPEPPSSPFRKVCVSKRRRWRVRGVFPRASVDLKSTGNLLTALIATPRFPHANLRLATKFSKLWRTRQDSNLWPLPSEGCGIN